MRGKLTPTDTPTVIDLMLLSVTFKCAPSAVSSVALLYLIETASSDLHFIPSLHAKKGHSSN